MQCPTLHCWIPHACQPSLSGLAAHLLGLVLLSFAEASIVVADARKLGVLAKALPKVAAQVKHLVVWGAVEGAAAEALEVSTAALRCTPQISSDSCAVLGAGCQPPQASRCRPVGLMTGLACCAGHPQAGHPHRHLPGVPAAGQGAPHTAR